MNLLRLFKMSKLSDRADIVMLRLFILKFGRAGPIYQCQVYYFTSTHFKYSYILYLVKFSTTNNTLSMFQYKHGHFQMVLFTNRPGQAFSNESRTRFYTFQHYLMWALHDWKLFERGFIQKYLVCYTQSGIFIWVIRL